MALALSIHGGGGGGGATPTFDDDTCGDNDDDMTATTTHGIIPYIYRSHSWSGGGSVLLVGSSIVGTGKIGNGTTEKCPFYSHNSEVLLPSSIIDVRQQCTTLECQLKDVTLRLEAAERLIHEFRNHGNNITDDVKNDELLFKSNYQPRMMIANDATPSVSAVDEDLCDGAYLPAICTSDSLSAGTGTGTTSGSPLVENPSTCCYDVVSLRTNTTDRLPPHLIRCAQNHHSTFDDEDVVEDQNQIKVNHNSSSTTGFLRTIQWLSATQQQHLQTVPCDPPFIGSQLRSNSTAAEQLRFIVPHIPKRMRNPHSTPRQQYNGNSFHQ
jgi:hypothetical protein